MADNFYSPAPAEPGARDNFWVPFLAAAGLFLIDYFFIRGVFSLPLLLLMLLIFLAFRLPPWMVAVWALMYAGVILAILLLPLQEAISDPALRPYMRTAVFLAGASAAVLLASQRLHLEKGRGALFSIISALPSPVIVSDISGNIMLLNQAAQAVLKNHVGDFAGLSYFSTFVNQGNQGQTIAKYISYFDPARVGPIAIALRTRGESPLVLRASINVVEIGKSRFAVTVIERVEEAA